MRFETGCGPQFDIGYVLERAIIRPNPIMLFRKRECDKWNIVWIDRTYQRIGGRKMRCDSFKGNDDHGGEQQRQQSIDLINIEASRTGNLGTMPGDLVKGKGRQEKCRSGRSRMRLVMESLMMAATRIFVSRTSLMRAKLWHSGDATLP